MMKFTKSFMLVAGVLGCVLALVIAKALHSRPTEPLTTVPPEMLAKWKQDRERGMVSNPSNDLAQLGHNRETFRPGLAGLTETERGELKQEFEAKLQPALKQWTDIYARHLPFRADEVTLENYHSKIQHGTYGAYTFMVNGATLTFEDTKGVARVVYLNTPETKKLMELPQGQAPNMSMPITREEVTNLIREDSGKLFPPDQIHMVPTAASSAMQGGVHVMVGGDMSNSASWLFTLTFSPDSMLNYYLRGADVLSQAPKLAK